MAALASLGRHPLVSWARALLPALSCVWRLVAPVLDL